MAVLPQHVCACERCVPTQRDFRQGREPPQAVTVFLRKQERGFRQIHLERDVLHPFLCCSLLENADRGRIACKWLRGERIHLRDSNIHPDISRSTASGGRLNTSRLLNRPMITASSATPTHRISSCSTGT